jgi:N utilization substance protein B
LFYGTGIPAFILVLRQQVQNGANRVSGKPTERQGKVLFINADREYFEALLKGATESSEALDAQIGSLVDRPVAQLDPVEHAVLMIGIHELLQSHDVPYRVVINEGVELAKRFGATDGHKFVNAVLDRAARSLRSAEQAAAVRA